MTDKELKKIEDENITIANEAESAVVAESWDITLGDKLIVKAVTLNNRLLMELIKKSSNNIVVADPDSMSHAVKEEPEAPVFKYGVMVDLKDGTFGGIDGPNSDLESFGAPNLYKEYNENSLVILELIEGMSDRIYRIPSEDGETWITPIHSDL